MGFEMTQFLTSQYNSIPMVYLLALKLSNYFNGLINSEYLGKLQITVGSKICKYAFLLKVEINIISLTRLMTKIGQQQSLLHYVS